MFSESIAMKFLAVAAAISLALVSQARADWEYTKWGMTPAQVISASHGDAKITPAADRYKNEEDHWEMGAEGTYRSGPMTFSVGFAFDTASGGLTCVYYNLSGDQALLLKDSMIKKYGAPKDASGDPDMFAWRTPDKIELMMGHKPAAAVVTHCAP
jgi:hypothetical protein